MDVILGVPASLVFVIAVLRTIANSLFAEEPAEAAAGPLNGFKCRPFVSDVVPTKDSVLADFTAPVTAGLGTAVAPVAGASFQSEDGAALVVAGACQFVASATPAEQETVYGVVWTDAAGTGLVAAERFEEPVIISASGQGFVYVPRFSQPRM